MAYRVFRRPPLLLISVIVAMCLGLWVRGIENWCFCVCGLWVSGFVRVCMCMRARVFLCVKTFVYSCVVIVLMRLCGGVRLWVCVFVFRAFGACGFMRACMSLRAQVI